MIDAIPNNPSEESLLAWCEAFLNRALPYAVQQGDGTYRWHRGACTTEVLAAHLRGETTVAVSSSDQGAHCRWLCLDLDDPAPDALARLLVLRTALASLGLSGLVEASRRGGHLWLLLDTPAPVVVARAALLAALARLRVASVPIPDCEVYPDELATVSGALGHAVRLPLGIHRLTGRRYPLFDEDGHPCAFTSTEAALRFLLAWPRLTEQRVADLAREWTLQESGSGHEPFMHMPAGGTPPHNTMGTRSAVIRWVDAVVTPLDLLAEFAPDVEMQRRGQGYVGWCPFHDDRAPDGRGRPGTPSFYVVFNARYGWSWRCLSTNCAQYPGPMRHSFRLFQELLGLDPVGALRAASMRWPGEQSVDTSGSQA